MLLYQLLGSKFVSVGVLSDDFAAVDFREELCYHSRPKVEKFKRNTEREKSKEESRARRKKRKPVRSGSEGTAPLRRAFGLIFLSFLCLLLRGVCLAAARVSAPHLSMPSTRPGAKEIFAPYSLCILGYELVGMIQRTNIPSI